jgi:CBS domain-containing protein
MLRGCLKIALAVNVGLGACHKAKYPWQRFKCRVLPRVLLSDDDPLFSLAHSQFLKRRPAKLMKEKPQMKACEIMTKRVVSIRPDASIVQAINLMLRSRFSGLPVVDRSKKLVGIITEGDFLHRREIGTERRCNAWLVAMFGPEQSAHHYVRAHSMKVADIMSHSLITVDEKTPLEKIVSLMEQHHIKRLPVLRKAKLVGIISRANLLRVLSDFYHSPAKMTGRDRAIHTRIVADINEQDWAYGSEITVLVRNGIVDLCGTLADSSQREALKALVREKAGVRKLHDHLRLSEEGLEIQ